MTVDIAGLAVVAIIVLVSSRVIGLRRGFYWGGYRGRSAVDGGETRELLNRVNALEQELTEVKTQLGEAEERLDFTERVLARQKDAGKLAP